MNRCWCGNTDLMEYSQHYYKCNKCGTLISKLDFSKVIYFVQDEENDLYGKNYWETKMEKAIGQDSLGGVIDRYFHDRVPYWLEKILKYVPLSSSVAEVGCGLGQLAYLMKTIGFQQMAFEMSPEICSYISKELEINVKCGELQTSEETYDAVLAFDVIEHIMEPELFVSEVVKRLRAGGVLCIQTPRYREDLTYDEMLEETPRFIEQLKEKEHIFLYSTRSMRLLLEKHGFKYFYQEPACFGDDYDMFLFASKTQIAVKSRDEVFSLLDRMKCGRIVKSLIQFYERDKELEEDLLREHVDNQKRWETIVNTQNKLEESESDRNVRLEVINDLQKRLEESEADRNARLDIINDLQKRLKESESDRDARLSIINDLQKRLEESESDRDARLGIIKDLQKRLEESESDPAARLENIESLQKQ